MFPHSHPLINQGGGRIKTDPINEQRIRQVMANYQKYSIQKLGGFDTSSFAVNETTVKNSRIVLPLSFTIAGALGNAAFVHKNSKYIGKIFIIGMFLLGYKIYDRYQQSYNHSLYFQKFPEYPEDIRKMIENNDARYAHRWQKEDFMNIKL